MPARHGCGHDASLHADMRTPSGHRRLYRGGCHEEGCTCARWMDETEQTCPGIVEAIGSPSGKRYGRCRCGGLVGAVE